MGKASDKLWELESQLPNSIKPYTDKIIRGGTKIAKKLHPLGEDTRKVGKAWVQRHNPLKKKTRR